MHIPFAKELSVTELEGAIEDNIEKYVNGDFFDYFSDKDKTLDSGFEIRLEKSIGNEIGNYDFKKKENEIDKYWSLKVFKGIKGIIPSIGKDNRLWTYLTHTHFADYCRKRHAITSVEKATVKVIKQRFFCQGISRGIERDNAVSRLWWNGYLASKVQGMQLERALELLLYNTDIRQQIVERPFLSTNSTLLSAVIHVLDESEKNDGALLERDTFRKKLARLNLYAGSNMLEAHELRELINLVKGI
ncbi:DUF6339 family protein [Kangiella spongicola]|uniref:Uncharacterized protein n=1 Tax=Kangiella spongicola TaxID=796379 RepID=A0A318D4B1_9GAMM|nr:DUF6339 family protein [Kangiella spongicola]PXF64132.1 hypothetical protein DL796_03050 [Kangiella spongicola]